MVKKISELPLQASPGGTAEIEINDGAVSKRSPLSFIYDRTNHTGTQTISTISDLAAGAVTFTNKVIDADNNTISNLAHGAEVDDPTNNVHGVTGNVVGSSDTQTLTNKSIGAFLDFLDTSAPADPGTVTTGRLYVKQVDVNNQGLFIKIKQAGSIVEVQIV